MRKTILSVLATGKWYGDIYSKLSTLTAAGFPIGTIIGSVCEADYGSQLAAIGQSIQDMKKSIKLQCAPLGLSQHNVSIDRNVQPFNERFDMQGLTLIFETPLPVGEYKLSYDCN